MHSNQFLLDASPLGPGEDAREYLRSAAHRNGLPVRRLAHIVADRCRRDASTAALFEAAGTTLKVLRHLRIPSSGAGGNARRVCTACIRDAMPTLEAWQTAPFAYCHLHRTRLVDKCPGCSKRLTWTADLGNVCDQCSTSLAQHVSVRAAGSTPESDLVEAVHRAALLNLDPTKCLDGNAGNDINVAEAGTTPERRDRLTWTYSLAREGRLAQTTAEPGFCVQSSWRKVIGPSIDTLVRHVSISAARIRRNLGGQRREFRFPTGWEFLDARVAEEIQPLLEMPAYSLRSLHVECVP